MTNPTQPQVMKVSEDHMASRDHARSDGGVREPWKSEPDRKEWIDEASGYPCLMMRGPGGAWCGYVGVPTDHPAHGLSYYSSSFDVAEIIAGDIDIIAKARVQLAVNDVIVHGGMTFDGKRETAISDERFHWFGFDCAHAGDYCPGCERIEELGRPTGWGSVVEYRDLSYVEAEVTSLAAQLKAISDDSASPAKDPTNV